MVHRADEQSHDWYVEITKVPPLPEPEPIYDLTAPALPVDDTEREKAIRDLKAKMEGQAADHSGSSANK